MVQSASVTAMVINIIICIGMPLGCITYMFFKRQRPFIPFLVGLTTFIVFQLVLHVTLMGLIVSTQWYENLLSNTWLYGLFVGITTGLFAEVGRYAGFKLLLKDRRLYTDGIAMGVGYAGFESIFIGGLQYFSSLSLANMINSGQTNQLTAMMDPEAAGEAIKSMTAIMPIDIYLGGLNQIFIFIIHIALTLFILLGIQKRKLSFLGIAVLSHLIIDGLPEAFAFSAPVTVIFAGILAALSVVFILKAKNQFEPVLEED